MQHSLVLQKWLWKLSLKLVSLDCTVSLSPFFLPRQAVSCIQAHTSKTLHCTWDTESPSCTWLLLLLNVPYERVLLAHFSLYGLKGANHQLLLSLLTLHSGARHNRAPTHAFTRSPAPTLLLFNFSLLPHSAYSPITLLLR